MGISIVWRRRRRRRGFISGYSIISRLAAFFIYLSPLKSFCSGSLVAGFNVNVFILIISPQVLHSKFFLLGLPIFGGGNLYGIGFVGTDMDIQ